MRRAGLLWNTAHSSPIYFRAFSSTSRPNAPLAVDTLAGTFETISVNEFRTRAFVPEKPVLVTTHDAANSVIANRNVSAGLPASEKWFLRSSQDGLPTAHTELAQTYLSGFGNTIMPYELLIDPKKTHVASWIEAHGHKDDNREVAEVLRQLLQSSSGESFHRFNAPLSLFLKAGKERSPTLQMLYIAQAQIADLPEALRNDLPTPRLVNEAGKGDVYDANIWLGLPPTYTPLHKDPNPNLFVQLASSKIVRLFPPIAGRALFFEVQHKIGQQASASFRGHEMMEGLERHALEEAVWGDAASSEGFEATVRPGDALFIPKGWWHSIRSIGDGLTASVNWWFR